MDLSRELYFSFDLSQHHRDKSNTYSCSICSSSYSYEYNLRRHVLRTHVNRAYLSPKDLATFDLSLSEHHIQIPSSLMLYSCNICQRLFSDSGDITTHFKNLHSAIAECSNKERVMIIKCPDCKTKFSNMRSLNCHMRYHRNGWTANGRSSISAASHTATSTAHSSIPSTLAISNASLHSTSGKAKTSSIRSGKKSSSSAPTLRKDKTFSPSATNGGSKTVIKSKRTLSGKGHGSNGPSTVIKVTTTHRTKAKEKAAAGSNPTISPGASHATSNSDAQLLEKGRQLRQRTSMQKQASLFTCTVCKKTFHSYGNMMRHRRLSHEVVIRRRPELIHMRRKTKRQSKFCDPKVARRYLNKVASDIAFNMKNCVHGNAKHMEISSNCIRTESKTNLRELKVNAISKKMMKHCNIRTKSAASLAKHAGSSSKCSTNPSSSEQTSTMKQISQDSKSPDVYDKPGLWKFLCLVCLQYFPNTLELFEHQDTVHKSIEVGYMEVGKSYELPLHSVATSKPVGCIPVSEGHDIVCNPTKYTCTKCQQQFKSSAELHPHLTTCGKELLKPLQIKIPPTQADKTYGKVKGKKRHWQRGNVEYQRKLTDMHGFNVRKKKRLVMEVKEQERLEKLKAENLLSLESHLPSQQSSDISDGKEGNTDSQASSEKQTSTERVYKFKYSCEYCGITFKYKKVYERHVDRKCEMLKRITSPDQSDTDQTEEPEKEEPKEEPLVAKLDSEDEKAAKADVVEDYFSPQQSLAQARVLAKFIHPARTCGPCFTCKKPNMARRYSHLQQRSDNFVQFVMSRCKNISVQSCICKACELNYKRDYDKRKLRLDRYAACRKAASRTRSSKPFTQSSSQPFTQLERVDNQPTKQKPSHKPSKPASSAAKVSLEKTKLDIKNRRRVNRAGNKITWKKDKTRMSSVNRRNLYDKPVQAKSLEQIFPEDVEEFGDSSTRTPASSGSALSPAKVIHGGDFYLTVDQDIIDVEREMVDKDELLTEEVEDNRQDGPSLEAIAEMVINSKPSINKMKYVGDDHNTLTTAPRPLKKSEFDSVDSAQDGHVMGISLRNKITEEEQNNARLKVILQFVKDSKRFDAGQKLSLTEIIDAVTEKVKEDPRLAVTLTSAIESACDSGGAFTRKTRWSLPRTGGVQESKSLPSVLDGLVTKIDSVTSSQLIMTPPMTATSNSSPQLTHTPKTKEETSDVNAPTNNMKESSASICKTVDNISENSQPTSPTTSIATGQSCKVHADSPTEAMPTSHLGDTVCSSESPMLNSSTASEPVPALSPLFPVPKARKRRNSSSTSSSTSHSSYSAVTRKKFVMTDSSYKHMVEIIDAVACGDIHPPSSPHFDDDSHSVSSSDASASQSGSQGSRYSYDFMVDFKDSLDCIRTADQPAGPNPHPIKNLRLANIINKLSSGSRDDSKQSAPVTSPTNPNSIDSGFTSLAE